MEKGNLQKNKDSISNIPIKAANICNVFPRPADANELIAVQSKKSLRYRGYVYFEPVGPNVINKALNYLKTHNKFYENVSISEGHSSKKMINFSETDKHQDIAERIYKKVISNEAEYGSVKGTLSMHRIGSNETALISKIPYIIND